MLNKFCAISLGYFHIALQRQDNGRFIPKANYAIEGLSVDTIYGPYVRASGSAYRPW